LKSLLTADVCVDKEIISGLDEVLLKPLGIQAVTHLLEKVAESKQVLNKAQVTEYMSLISRNDGKAIDNMSKSVFTMLRHEIAMAEDFQTSQDLTATHAHLHKLKGAAGYIGAQALADWCQKGCDDTKQGQTIDFRKGYRLAREAGLAFHLHVGKWVRS